MQMAQATSAQMDAAVRARSNMVAVARDFERLALSDDSHLLFFHAGLAYGTCATAPTGEPLACAQLAARLNELERRAPPSNTTPSTRMTVEDGEEEDGDEPLVVSPPLPVALVGRVERLAASLTAVRDDALRRCTDLQGHLATVLRQSREREERVAVQRDEAIRRCAEMQHQLTMVLQQSHEREQARQLAVAQRDEALGHIRQLGTQADCGSGETQRLRTELVEARHAIDQLRAVRLPDAVARLQHRVDELERSNHKLVGQVVLSHTEKQELQMYRRLHFDPVCSPASPFDALSNN